MAPTENTPTVAPKLADAPKTPNQTLLDAKANLTSADTEKQKTWLQALETAAEQVKKDPVLMKAIETHLDDANISPEIRARLEALLLKVNPEAALKRAMERSKPNKTIEDLIKLDGKVDTHKLSTMTEAEIKTKFNSLNKWDLVALLSSMSDTANANISEQEKKAYDTVKTIVKPLVEQMIKNGFSIETTKDSDFLLIHGSEAVRTAITEARGDKWLLKDPGKKCILRQAPGGKITLTPIPDKPEDIQKLDLSRLNTASSSEAAKTMQEQIKKAGVDPEKISQNFGQSIDSLLNSNNSMMKWLWELMKFFGTLLWFYKEGGKPMESWKEKMPDWLKISLLENILATPKNDSGYKIDDIKFDKDNNLEKPKDEPSRKYIADVQKLLDIHETERDSSWNETLIYGPKTRDAVLNKQKTLFPGETEKAKHTGRFDRTTATTLLESLKPAQKPEPKVEAKEEAKSEIPPEKSAALKSLEWKKTFKSSESIKAIQTLVGAEPDGKLGPKTRAAIKELQGKLWVSQDGNFWPKTLDALQKNTKVLEAPKSTAPKAEAKK